MSDLRLGEVRMIALTPEDRVVRITPARGSKKVVHLPGEDGKPICQYRSRRTQLVKHKTYWESSWAAVVGHFELCSECAKLSEQELEAANGAA